MLVREEPPGGGPEEEIQGWPSGTLALPPPSPSCCGRCGQSLRRLLPVGAWREARELVKIGAPVFVAQLLGFLISVVSSIFCGHLGKAELDAVTLAVSVINVIGISVGTGLASVCDTLMSQTYGSKNVKRVGTILQRAILILLLFCFPCWAFFVNTEQILLLCRQDPEVSRLTQVYVMIFIPALPAAFIYQLQIRYLQSQAILLPQVVTGMVANILNVIMNTVFLYSFELGVVGSAWANTLSQNLQAVLLFLYVWWKKMHKETWGGWTRDCLQEWGSFIRLALPSMLMICIEWWTFEIGSFLAGMISVVQLGAQSIIYELATVAYLLPQGISVASSVRVGNALGAGDVEQAKLSCITGLLCTGVFALVFTGLLVAVKDVVAYIFTSDREIAALVAKVMMIFAPFHLLDAIALKLWNKFRVSNIPSLIFIDAATGKVVCRNGLLVIRDDPEGLEFPWGPRPFSEVVAGPLLRNSGQAQESTILEGSHVGVYFSAHWCPPCRSLTRVLVESYRKIKESGQKFEIVFVSADRSEDSFKQYFSEMPWLAIPYADEGRRSRLNRLYGIQGIPTLIVLDPKGDVITRQGRVEVLNDVECKEFPWHPKPVLELTDSNAVQLNEGPCLVLFVDSDDDGESEAAKQLIQPIAEKIIAKYKAKDEEAPLLFFVAGEDDMTDSLRDYTNLPEAAPLLTILDMSARAKYVMDVEEITPDIVEAFVNDFLADKLKPEPI
ncbi:nucleoredoxin isoform X2 [Rhineura floridana]|uniref:nucleoredoxin isoform X2 n=1 Tax=Rhineura floridana TaxID=261503 RepID=UPI002AC8065D|nr:nucleoredoxin isoform X2 [Rhineura floridana]